MVPSPKAHSIIFTILAIISVVKTGNILSRYFDISRNGTRVVGTIVEVEKRPSSRGSTLYPVYEYRYEEQTYRAQEDRESIIPPSIGTQVSLTIDKRDPRRLTTGFPILWPLLTALILWMLVFGRRFTVRKSR